MTDTIHSTLGETELLLWTLEAVKNKGALFCLKPQNVKCEKQFQVVIF